MFVFFTWVWKLQAGAVLRTWCCRCSDRSSHFALWMYSRFAWALARMRRASLSAASRSPALLRFSPQYGPQLSPLKSCSFRSQGALLKLNAGPDFPLQTRKWIGLGLCYQSNTIFQDGLLKPWRKLGSPSWVWFYSAERRKEECIYKSHLMVTIWGSLPSCCSNFSGERFLLFYPLPPLTLRFSLHSHICFAFFLRDRVGVALELPKINTLPLRCYSD